jgi:hypothetical protein
MKKLITTLLLLTSIATLYAIPGSVLEAQEVLRAKIEIALKWCKRTNSCSYRRDQIIADLREYIAGQKADIEFCQSLYQRLAQDDNERREVTKAIEEYQQEIQWAEHEIQSLSK